MLPRRLRGGYGRQLRRERKSVKRRLLYVRQRDRARFIQDTVGKVWSSDRFAP